MSKKRWLLGGGLLGIVIVGVAVWFLFLKDDAPDAVTNEDANADLDDVLDNAPDPTDPTETAAPDDTTGEPGSPGTTAGLDGSIDGTWIVDDVIGEFDFETASGSFAGFRVAEELDVVGDVTSVGRSGGVTGTVTIADGTLNSAEVTVDMTAIVSDRSQREGAIKRTVGADEFPTASFVFAESVDVSAVEVGGEAIPFSVAGDLTVRGVTQPVTFEIEANVREDGFGIITGSAEIVWADFGVTTPSAPIVVSVADQGTVEFQLVVERG